MTDEIETRIKIDTEEKTLSVFYASSLLFSFFWGLGMASFQIINFTKTSQVISYSIMMFMIFVVLAFSILKYKKYYKKVLFGKQG